MRGATRNILIGLLAVFMVCLIVSTATTTVTAADGWGTLKAGDEMQWQSDSEGTVKMKMISVEGDIMVLELTKGGSKETLTIDATADAVPNDKIYPWLVPEGDLSGQTKTYDFGGTTYQADYSTSTSGSGEHEFWTDKNTGILFEWSSTSADGTKTVHEKLTSTTADLAESTGSYGSGTGGCLGTLLIALVSVTAVVSYSVLWKKKKL